MKRVFAIAKRNILLNLLCTYSDFNPWCKETIPELLAGLYTEVEGYISSITLGEDKPILTELEAILNYFETNNSYVQICFDPVTSGEIDARATVHFIMPEQTDNRLPNAVIYICSDETCSDYVMTSFYVLDSLVDAYNKTTISINEMEDCTFGEPDCIQNDKWYIIGVKLRFSDRRICGYILHEDGSSIRPAWNMDCMSYASVPRQIKCVRLRSNYYAEWKNLEVYVDGQRIFP